MFFVIHFRKVLVTFIFKYCYYNLNLKLICNEPLYRLPAIICVSIDIARIRLALATLFSLAIEKVWLFSVH